MTGNLAAGRRSFAARTEPSPSADAADVDEAVAVLREYCDHVGAKSLSYDTEVAKVSVVGAGMETHEGVAARMFEALADANINIQMISTSEIKVSVLIAREDADRAVAIVHSAFFDDSMRL